MLNMYPKHLYTPVGGTPTTKEMEGQRLPDTPASQGRGANVAGWGHQGTFKPTSSTSGHPSRTNPKLAENIQRGLAYDCETLIKQLTFGNIPLMTWQTPVKKCAPRGKGPRQSHLILLYKG